MISDKIDHTFQKIGYAGESPALLVNDSKLCCLLIKEPCGRVELIINLNLSSYWYSSVHESFLNS